MRSALIMGIALVLFLLLFLHRQEGLSIEGYVIDEESKIPLGDALIVAVWGEYHGSWHGPGGGAPVVAKEAITDQQGYFFISSWKRTTLFSKPFREDEPTLYVWKEGYYSPNLESYVEKTSTNMGLATEKSYAASYKFENAENKIELTSIEAIVEKQKTPYWRGNPPYAKQFQAIKDGSDEPAYREMENLFYSLGMFSKSKICLPRDLPVYTERVSRLFLGDLYKHRIEETRARSELLAESMLNPLRTMCEKSSCKYSRVCLEEYKHNKKRNRTPSVPVR